MIFFPLINLVDVLVRFIEVPLLGPPKLLNVLNEVKFAPPPPPPPIKSPKPNGANGEKKDVLRLLLPG